MEQKFISVREASSMIGVSRRLLYEIIAKRELRSYRVHKRIVIAVEDLGNYVRQNVVEPVEDWGEKLGLK